MSVTATQLIYQSLRDIGCLRPGQGTSVDVLNDGLVALNQMIQDWFLDDLLIFTTRIDAYTLTGGIQIYTIGPAGAMLVGTRPTEIQEANIILNTVTPVVRMPLSLINDAEWAGIAVQSIPFAIPLRLYYDGGYNQAQGFARIYLWPGPQAAYQLELFTPEQLQQFADLTTVYRFPPAYERALRKNLAIEIVPMMKVYFKIQEPLLAAVKMQADETLSRIRSFNAPDPILAGDPAYSGGAGAWNYAIGENRTRGRR